MHQLNVGLYAMEKLKMKTIVKTVTTIGMEKYIKKSTLIAEIEKRINDWTIRSKNSLIGQGKDTCESRITELNDLLSFIDILEVKEVDLEKEFDKCCENYIFDDECEIYTARHFFELGLKAQKGE